MKGIRLWELATVLIMLTWLVLGVLGVLEIISAVLGG